MTLDPITNRTRRWAAPVALATALGLAAWTIAACTPPTTGGSRPTTTTSTTTTTVPTWIAAGQCFDGAASQDMQFVGPVNAANNVLGYASTDGTCTGGTVGAATLVRAADQAEADALCADLTPATPVALNALGSGVVTTPALPADAWQCWFTPV